MSVFIVIIVKEDCIVVVQCFWLYSKRGDAVYDSIIVVDSICCWLIVVVFVTYPLLRTLVPLVR